jgi:hypothetical protein
MVSVRFVFAIVPTVRMLVGLDTKQGGADDKPMVDASPHRTLAVASFHRLVMDKAFKITVDRFPHREFLRLVVVDLALRMTGKQVLEAGRAVAIVVLLTSSRVRPVNTVGASEASAVLDALVGLASSTIGTVLDHTALAATVLDALVGLALSTIGTVLDHTALAAAMLNALVGLASSTPGTVLDHTALASTMPTAFVGLAFSPHGTVLDHTALAATVLNALVGLAFSTIGTVLDHTALASTMPTALVGISLSTIGTVLDHTALASTMPTALVGLSLSKILTARLNTLFCCILKQPRSVFIGAKSMLRREC